VSASVILIAIPIAGMIAAVIAHLLACHARIPHRKALAISLAIGAIITATEIVGVLAEDLAPTWMTLDVVVVPTLFFCAWWFVFLNFVQSLESSLRIRVLLELTFAGGSMDEEALRKIYNDEALMRLRLTRLTDAKAIVLRDGRLFAQSAALVAMGRLARWLKKLILGRESEFSESGFTAVDIGG
jgi:hypothetical protein